MYSQVIVDPMLQLVLGFCEIPSWNNMLKSIFYKNSYLRDFVDRCIKELLDWVLTPKIVISTVPKKDLMLVLPYLGKLPMQVHTRIDCVMKN